MREAVHNPSGTLSSAAKMHKKVGVRCTYDKLWVPGEGWVKWADLHREVAEAYRQWRIKRSLKGDFIMDGAERQQADIAEAVARRNGK